MSFAGNCEGEGKALEVGFLAGTVIGGHYRTLADAEACVHDLVLRAGRDHAGRWQFGALLVAHHHLHFGIEGLPVEFDSLLAIAIEE